MAEALIEVLTMRRFTGIKMISNRIPDQYKIMIYRHQLEIHDPGEQIFWTVKVHPISRGIKMRQGR